MGPGVEIARKKALARERNRRYRAAHPARVQNARKRWLEANIEQMRECRRRWAKTNPEYQRQWREANPERTREGERRWREANSERKKENDRRWAEANRARVYAAIAKYNAIRRGAQGAETVERQYVIERDGSRCHICEKVCLPEEIHLDHLVPLSAGGSHTHDNLAVACAHCNQSRGPGRIPAQLLLFG